MLDTNYEIFNYCFTIYGINYCKLILIGFCSRDGKLDEQDYDSDNFSQDKSSGDHTYGQSADKEKKGEE